MELRAQVVDRVLEAIGPTLSREIELLIQESRQNLEAEFQNRLQAGLQEAEAASRRLAEVQLEQTIADSDSVRKQLTEEIEFGRTQLRKDFEEASAEWAAERARLTNELEEWRFFAEAPQRLREAGSQSEMLLCFMKLAERFSSSVAVYISKADGLQLWKTHGDAVFPQIVSNGTIDPELFYRQIAVRDKVVLAVCASQPCKVDGLNFLISSLERSIELIGMKLRSPLPKAVVSIA